MRILSRVQSSWICITFIVMDSSSHLALEFEAQSAATRGTVDAPENQPKGPVGQGPASRRFFSVAGRLAMMSRPLPPAAVSAARDRARRAEGREEDAMRFRFAAAAVIALAAVCPRPASPEVVELNGGDWVEGTLKEATPAGVVVEVGGQTITFSADRVRAIYFRAPGQQPTAAAPTPPQSSAAPPSPGAGGADRGADGGAVQGVIAGRGRAPGGEIPPLRHPRGDDPARVPGQGECRGDDRGPLPGGTPGRPRERDINDAVRYFVLAESAWNNQGAARGRCGSGRSTPSSAAPSTRTLRALTQSKGDAFDAERVKNYVVISDGVISVLWVCASDKIAEAETLIAQDKK